MIARNIMLALLALPLLTFAQTEKKGLATLDQPGYSIQYPAEWQVDQSGMMGTKFILVMPSGNPEFSPNINLVQQELPTDDVPMDATLEATLEQLENMLGDFKLISQKKFNTPSGPCSELEYTGTFGENAMHWKQRYWLRNKMVHVLTFTALKDDFARVVDSGKSAMDSFWLK